MKLKHIKDHNAISLFFSIIIGVLSFYWIVGFRILDPTNIAWINNQDTITHYLGWVFFRNSDWSFPLGLNPSYGLEFSSSILFSDSNPLLAFLFKPFSQWLPETFQYFGIWLLACFIFQAWLGWKLTRLASTSLIICFLGAAFFTFAPPMLIRLHGHFNLVGHFLILGALYLALNQNLQTLKKTIIWYIILLVAALVHAYILAMVAAIWLADLADRRLKHVMPTSHASVEFFTMTAIIIIACWQIGYFSVGQGVGSSNYGSFQMNLLSVIHPHSWSYVLNDIPQGVGNNFESFNYLGLGVIFLFICASPIIFLSRSVFLKYAKRYLVLLVVLFFMIVFSVSNNIQIAEKSIEFDLSDTVLKIAGIFHASGRFFWPIFYLIIFSVIFIIIHGYKKNFASFLLTIALILQVADTHSGWGHFRDQFMIEPSSIWETSLSDPFWDIAALKYEKIRWVPPQNLSPHWTTLATYASTHGLATDAVYLARIRPSARKIAHRRTADLLENGHYEADTLYVFDNSVVDQIKITLRSDGHFLGLIDGLFVLTPNWKHTASVDN